MKRFLIFQSKTICYQSLYAFTDCMANALRSKGHNVTICDLRTAPDMTNYLRTSYDAIIDFNSSLPTQTLSDGTCLLDALNGPFYNYLIDHPLYYHEQLIAPVSTQHVICIDRKHERYLKKYYSNLASVHFLPLGMMPASKEENLLPLEDRHIPLLFTGTYTPLECCCNKINRCHPDIQKEVRTLIEKMDKNRSLSIEDAMTSYIQELGVTVSPQQFAGFTYSHFLADTYIAAKIRDDVIRQILASDLSLTVCGHSWDHLRDVKTDHLTILPERSFFDSVALASDARILLNIMPWFKDGLHDRILTAMSHRTVSCSDRTDYLTDFFPDDAILTYSLDHLAELSHLLRHSLSDYAYLENMAEKGQHFALTHFTWEHQMTQLLTYL